MTDFSDRPWWIGNKPIKNPNLKLHSSHKLVSNVYIVYNVLGILGVKLTLREEMAWEDYQGFPRATAKPYLCNKCGKEFVTREMYFVHKETCKKAKKQTSAYEQTRRQLQEQAFKQFKKENGI